MVESSDEEQLITREYYRERIIEQVIRKPGKWVTYFEQTKYLIDMPTSLRMLEKLVRELK